MEFLDLSLTAILSNLARIMVAYGLALPIAWEREGSSHSAGLRTFFSTGS